MKNLIILVAFTLFCASCEKDNFDIENPDVNQFVREIKNGTYNNYELGENGEKLWALMPYFKKEQIPLLLEHAFDTSLISPWEHIPLNPANSIPPYRMINGETYIMLGEYLLWCVEGIIEEKDFASLTPILSNQHFTGEEGLIGKEILEVRELYLAWWNEYVQTGETAETPLEGTVYWWR